MNEFHLVNNYTLLKVSLKDIRGFEIKTRHFKILHAWNYICTTLYDNENQFI